MISLSKETKINGYHNDAAFYVGLSTDDLAGIHDAPNCSIFIQMDTGKTLVYDKSKGVWMDKKTGNPEVAERKVVNVMIAGKTADASQQQIEIKGDDVFGVLYPENDKYILTLLITADDENATVSVNGEDVVDGEYSVEITDKNSQTLRVLLSDDEYETVERTLNLQGLTLVTEKKDDPEPEPTPSATVHYKN